MIDSPLSASAYEILRVAPTVDDDELRRAYRQRLRQTHPDTGGDAAVFIQVQRAWTQVGTPADRAAYDGRHGGAAHAQWSGWRPPAARRSSRPRARSHGEPGAYRRTRYLDLVAEWADRPITEAEAYDPVFVRDVPVDLRRLLATALAEEASADIVSDLGMGFTVWHGIATGAGDPPRGGERTLDHIILGPSGLYGMMSRDFGAPVGLTRDEIVGSAVAPETPAADALAHMRSVARAARVRFSGGIVVLPDDDLAQPIAALGDARVPVFAVRRSALRPALRTALPGMRAIGGNELFDIRTRVQQTARLV
ncbi:MAG: J domain-containing protein [Actinomycetota bacterium]